MLNNYLCKNNESMAKAMNPFIVTGKIAPEYFCDRITESARLVKSITNGNNMVIISPRRMGKTGLIRFCYDKPEIADEYYTFFIDICIRRACGNLPIFWDARYTKPCCRAAARWPICLSRLSSPSAANSDSILFRACRPSTWS